MSINDSHETTKNINRLFVLYKDKEDFKKKKTFAVDSNFEYVKSINRIMINS
jgi:hypothetical protein